MPRIANPVIPLVAVMLLFMAAVTPAFAQDELPDTPDVPDTVAGPSYPAQPEVPVPVVVDQAPVQEPVQAAVVNQPLPAPAASGLRVPSVGTGAGVVPARFDGGVLLCTALAVLACGAAYFWRPGHSRP